jgi:DNA mismatch repair protein MutL
MAKGNLPERIHRLPEILVNKIAAGEVIERPASVVKELLENSIDADASDITVEIKNGGSRLIRVLDNGHGIHVDDLLLALDRHTTSKIDKASDLTRISTLGFRGEALSSIAAVSGLTLTSRQIGTDHGWSIIVSVRESTPEILPAAHPVGTTVEVRDLFHNMPARRKFLRSERTELIHIQELIKRIALSRFNLSLCLVHNDRQIFQVRDDLQNPSNRVLKVLGKKFLDQALHVDQRAGNIALYGWVGLPEIARSQSDQQYIYLNGRVIRDKLISHAVRLAYQDLLFPGRYPAYLLYLELDLTAADINVHPTKHEVRFRDARNVHDFIYSTVAELLKNHCQTNIDSGSKVFTQSKTSSQEKVSINEYQSSNINESHADYRRLINIVKAEPHNLNSGTAVSLLKGRFMVSESDNKSILLDVYGARRLITLAKLKTAYDTGQVKSRPILVPLVLKMNASDLELINCYQDTLELAGLQTSQISHDTLQIRAIPTYLVYADALALVSDSIEFLKSINGPHWQTDDLLSMFAEHANDCAPVRLTVMEMNSLLADYYAIQGQLSATVNNAVLCKLNADLLKGLLSGRG